MKRQLPAFGSMTETCAVRRQSVDWLDQPQHWNTCTTHNNTTVPQAHAATCVTPTPRATCASSTRRYMRHTHTSSNMCLKHTPLHVSQHVHVSQTCSAEWYILCSLQLHWSSDDISSRRLNLTPIRKIRPNTFHWLKIVCKLKKAHKKCSPADEIRIIS